MSEGALHGVSVEFGEVEEEGLSGFVSRICKYIARVKKGCKCGLRGEENEGFEEGRKLDSCWERCEIVLHGNARR